MPLSQMLVRAGPNDLVALVTRDDIGVEDMEQLIEMADGITDATGATLAIFPEGVLADASNYSLVELIELRDAIDATIQEIASRSSVGDA